MNTSVGPSPKTSATPRGRLLITAGPTHEPIDAVRFIGNRSSGRMGIALANAATSRGWDVRLLLGPTCSNADPNVQTTRFQTTADLQALLKEHWPVSDVLVMGAAVADYRPRPSTDRPDAAQGKIKRSSGLLTLELVPTPDLVAQCAENRRPGQKIVGFALEPVERLMESAKSKIERKGLDLIVANPLETMDSKDIDAILVGPKGVIDQTPGKISKEKFALWLLERLESGVAAKQV